MDIIHLMEPSQAGDLEEQKYDATGDCEWFKFIPKDAQDWIGVFGCGDRGESFAIVSSTSSFSLVVSRGKAYAIDSKTRDVLYKIEDVFLQGGIAVSETSLIIVFDTNALYGYSTPGKKWDHYFQDVDGIRHLAVSGGKIQGEAYNYFNGKWNPWSIPLVKSKTI